MPVVRAGCMNPAQRRCFEGGSRKKEIMAERRFPRCDALSAVVVSWVYGSAWCAGAEYDIAAASYLGGDAWHGFQNTRSKHKTFFTRYEPATGEYLLGQPFCCRLADGKGNAARVERGQIIADKIGRVYLSGTSAHIAFAGYTKGELSTIEPVSATLQGAQDGWFAAVPHCPLATDMGGIAKTEENTQSEIKVGDTKD
jgi:hypothetical protein